MDIFDKAQEADAAQNKIAINNLLIKINKHKKCKGEINCVECGEEIPKKRRELLPFITTCIDCQKIKELKERNAK